MSIGVFNDKSIQPSDSEVAEMISVHFPLWEQLIQSVRRQYAVSEDFKFLYGKSYGWARRFKVKGQLLVSLFPTQGGFTAQVNLGTDEVEKALGMKMSGNIVQAIERATPFAEGRWLFIQVENQDDLQDVLRLVELRAQAKHLK